jgi:hypothetical protein
MKRKLVKILSVPTAGLLVSACGTAVHKDMLNGQHANNDNMVVAFQYSGRWVDRRVSMKRPNKERAEIAVMETRENETDAGTAEKRPAGWQGRKHDSRRY